MKNHKLPATVIVANNYSTALVNFQERIFARQILAQGDLRDQMVAALEAFVAGAKPDRVHRKGNDYDLENGTMLEHKESGRKGRARLYSHNPRPMRKSDVLTVKLHDRDRWNNPHDADGTPVKAFYRMTTVDGGQYDFFVKAPAKKKRAKKKSSED